MSPSALGSGVSPPHWLQPPPPPFPCAELASASLRSLLTPACPQAEVPEKTRALGGKLPSDSVSDLVAHVSRRGLSPCTHHMPVTVAGARTLQDSRNLETLPRTIGTCVPLPGQWGFRAPQVVGIPRTLGTTEQRAKSQNEYLLSGTVALGVSVLAPVPPN